MTSLSRERLRGGLAVAMAVLISFLGVRSTHAGDTDTKGGKTQVKQINTEDKAQTAADTTAGEASPPAAVPQLQLQDEGPSTADHDTVKLTRSRQPVVDDSDERPFWKSWIFWAVTGALVVGAVSVVAYTNSKTNSSLAPCPPEIVVSQGCFGPGR